ncbi:MAG TPA: 50S ribosomal protein L29 [Phycisphaerales bacterium]|nr:50S ribosomal protein L29 [Phycisphaerales bacterium]
MKNTLEVKKFKDEQLKDELASLQKKLFDLRTSTVTEKVKDTSQFSKTRRNIARLRTELRARELAASKK